MFLIFFFRRQLRKAVVDHVSDSFLEPDTPLLMLLAAAREGHEKEVEEFGEIFTDHASKLVEVCQLFFLHFLKIYLFLFTEFIFRLQIWPAPCLTMRMVSRWSDMPPHK